MGRIVVFEARGQDVALPGGGGDFDALQLLDDLREAVDADAAGVGGGAAVRVAAVGVGQRHDGMPCEEESHEIGGADGFDAAAQAAEGLAMDAGEQAAFAPFFAGGAGAESAAQDVAVAFEGDERELDGGAGQVQAGGQLGGGDGAGGVEVAAHDHFDDRVGVFGAFAGPVGGQGRGGGGEDGIGEEGGDPGGAFARDPDVIAAGALVVDPGGADGAAGADEAVEGRDQRFGSVGVMCGSVIGGGAMCGGARLNAARPNAPKPNPRRPDHPAEQGIVQFVGVAQRGSGGVDDSGDGFGIERAEAVGVDLEAAAERDRAGAALFEGGVVEEGIGVGVEQFVADRRCLGRVDGVDADGSALDAAQHVAEAVDVHPVAHAVGEGLLHERVVGGVDGTVHVLLAGGGVGEDGGEQVFGAHAEEVGRHRAAGVAAEEREAADGGPAPARAEQGGVGDHRLGEHALGGGGGDEVEDGGQREAVVGAEGDDEAVVGGGGLQLEVEGGAESLAQGEAPGAVDAAAERGVDDELHAAALVEEALGDEGGVGGQQAEGLAAGGEVVGDKRSGGRGQGGLVAEPAGDGFAGHAAGEAVFDVGAETADGGGELGGAGGGFAKPERHGGVGAGGVLDADAAGLDAADAPGGVAEQEDVAGAAVDGEVFIDGADDGFVGLGDDGVVGAVGDGAAAGDGGEAGAAAGAEAVVDAVAVQVGGAASAAGGDAVGEHLDGRVEGGAGQVGVGQGAADEVVERVFAAGAGGDLGDDLLGEDVERGVDEADLVELAGAHGPHEGGAFDGLVAGHREEAAFGRAADPVAGAADALHEGRDAAGGAELDHQLDVADVDAEFERGGCDDAFEVAGFEALFGVEALGFGEAAVVGGDGFGAEAFAEGVADALGHAAGVGEDERGAVGGDENGHAIMDLRHLLFAGDGGEFVVGDFDAEVEGAGVAGVDNRGERAAGADEQAGDALDGLLGGGEADAGRGRAGIPGGGAGGRGGNLGVSLGLDLRFIRAIVGAIAGAIMGAVRAERVEAFEADREVAAALAAGDGVDLVDDHRPHRREHAPAALAGEQDVERLGRGDQDVRRGAGHAGAGAGGGVARAHRDLDGGRGQAGGAGRLADAVERGAQVALDVVAERLERGEVERVELGGEGADKGAAAEAVEAGEKSGEGLAGAGGGGDERVAPVEDRRPAVALRGRRGGEVGGEPRGDHRVESGERHARHATGVQFGGQPRRRRKCRHPKKKTLPAAPKTG